MLVLGVLSADECINVRIKSVPYPVADIIRMEGPRFGPSDLSRETEHYFSMRVVWHGNLILYIADRQFKVNLPEIIPVPVLQMTRLTNMFQSQSVVDVLIRVLPNCECSHMGWTLQNVNRPRVAATQQSPGSSNDPNPLASLRPPPTRPPAPHTGRYRSADRDIPQPNTQRQWPIETFSPTLYGLNRDRRNESEITDFLYPEGTRGSHGKSGAKGRDKKNAETPQ